MYSLIRQLLFLLPAELSHELTFKGLDIASQVRLLSLLVPKPRSHKVKLMGLEFDNPVGLAAGLDKNGQHIQALSELGFGFIEIGTVTPLAQSGNPKPRMFRLTDSDALINRMGFNNEGVDALVKNVQASRYQGVLGINIGKNKDTPLENAIDDYLICMEKVYELASYITINISSPNTPGLRELQSGSYLTELLDGLKAKQLELLQATGKNTPLVLKVAPDLDQDEVQSISNALLNSGLDGLIVSNTSIDKSLVTGQPHADEQGGLSGQPIFDASLAVQRQFHALLTDKIPLIAAGGIDSPDRAQQRLEGGASLVQVYTGFIYQGPGLISEIADRVATMGHRK
ncbi:MAG: dihydroorotate dehydrogenase (quinone) [Gammaproteobacteria bacterium]|nr:MAG: dihydroorotate dehydrogenase (quinone) [Gammaproteobacteria bacterium]